MNLKSLKPDIQYPSPGISYLSIRNDYWRLAYWAMGKGLITKYEADQIARVGSRKEIYWNRHLLDLIDIIDSREAKNEVHS